MTRGRKRRSKRKGGRRKIGRRVGEEQEVEDGDGEEEQEQDRWWSAATFVFVASVVSPPRRLEGLPVGCPSI